MARGTISSTHKAVQIYYRTLEGYADQKVHHETAVRSAFQNLLAETARMHGWMLIPELGSKGATRIIPDGTVRDSNSLPRGYWEAKDSRDDLDAEIKKKIARGYPTTNIIFEDTRSGVLYQGKQQVFRADLRKGEGLTDLLNQFFDYSEPDILRFEEAVDEFKERVPDLARGLAEKIRQAHQSNTGFASAFASFFALCQSAINPNIRRDAVDEMLVQHLLTERLIGSIFDKPEFIQQNAIAAEVEKVITALAKESFSRKDYLKSLNRFYLAIEAAARILPSFRDKQHFLNTVYERFFQGYSVKVADTHGIVYTPQPIVDFMCASIGSVLHDEFQKHLGDKEVYILDPCTGTGNFIVNVLHRLPKKDLKHVFDDQLFANEIMLLPYYISALNIEHAQYDIAGTYSPFEGLCFVDTLDIAEGSQTKLSFMTETNTARVERQRRTPITVIIGNPPYNANQTNENDNNRNRVYKIIDARIRETYAKDSNATLKNKLYDPYVKFFRWAVDRLGKRDGIVCMITNNSFVVDQWPFDGMRKHLMRDFGTIYHLDLHGNVRQNPKLSGTVHNVFGIQTGVGITIAIRKKGMAADHVKYHRVPESWTKEEKLEWLIRIGDIKNVKWEIITPDAEHNWRQPEHAEELSGLLKIGLKGLRGKAGKECVFKAGGTGAKSNRDDLVYNFDRVALFSEVERFSEAYNAEVDRLKRKRASGAKALDEFFASSSLRWSSTLKMHAQRGSYVEPKEAWIRTSLYRPFTKKFLYYDRILNDRPGWYDTLFPTSEAERENVLLCCTSHSQAPFSVLVANAIPNEAVGGRAGQCFPFYIYDADGKNRRENITDFALARFRANYQNSAISKWDIFNYVYALLHHSEYRARYADSLKRDLPRVLFAEDFGGFASVGAKLAVLHLRYEEQEPFSLEWIENPAVPLSYRVKDRLKLSKDRRSVVVNESLTLAGIPAVAFEYRIGSRSALEWLIEQYQVTHDAPTGITSDPNRNDDKEYIVRLIGQVVQVSVTSTALLKQLPGLG